MPKVEVEMTLPVRVRTYHVGDPDTIEQEWIVDYATRDGRAKIARHAGWAMNFGRGVEMEPLV